MDELFPAAAGGAALPLRARSGARDGHLLEVTINRPAARNSLHPMANDELDHVFDAYFADDELWAAILTGAGDKAFSAGNDLVYAASGQPMWVPKNGFGGLTSRRAPDQAGHRRRQRLRDGRRPRDRPGLPPVVADATAQFALSEVRVGLVAGRGRAGPAAADRPARKSRPR